MNANGRKKARAPIWDARAVTAENDEKMKLIRP
jgi:hypothetical protein